MKKVHRGDNCNLYLNQVVTRGGFHVGNGINWKGQVFSKMRNHTVTNRMTVCPVTQLVNSKVRYFLVQCLGIT